MKASQKFLQLIMILALCAGLLAPAAVQMSARPAKVQAALAAARRPRTPRPTQPPKKPLTPVTVNRHRVVVKMWDHGKQDGDVVDLYLNRQYLRRIRLTKGGSSVTLNLATGHHRFEVRALNEGTDKPNTASISITGVVKGRPRQSWGLKTGQITGMVITVQPS